MTTSDRGLMQLVAGALLLTVASQIFYVAVVSNAGSDTVLRPLTWFAELAAFSTITISAWALLARQPRLALVWSALGFAGLLNVLQVGIGLSMFGPALEAGDAEPQLFATVLAGAFFLYFLAKLVLGAVSVVLGLGALRRPGAAAKGLGSLALLTGAAAIAFNMLAMTDSKTWMFAAGAAGTGVSALIAILLLTSANAGETAASPAS